MSEKLQGRTAIVTGAASGIGAEIADLFAHHGARLMLVDLNLDMLEKVAQQCRSHGVKVATAKTDVSVSAEVAEAVHRCEKKIRRRRYFGQQCRFPDTGAMYRPDGSDVGQNDGR